MSRLFRTSSLVLVVILIAGTLSAQDSQPKEAMPAYALSILLGLGTGHYYLGDNGAPFLIGELVGIAGVAAGGVVALVSAYSAAYNYGSSFSGAFPGLDVGIGLIVAGGLTYFGIRVWEIVDVFGAVDRAKEAGRVVEIVPVVDVRRTSFELGVSLKY